MKKQYSLHSNILYAFDKTWKTDKSFFIYLIILIPVGLLLSLSDIYFPKLIIDMLEGNQDINIIINTILAYSVGVFFITSIRLLCNAKLAARKYTISQSCKNDLWEKYMTTDFQNTDTPYENIKFQNAMSDATNGCSVEFVWQSISELIKSILGIITYGVIISKLSSWIMIFIIFSSVLTFIIGKWQWGYSEKHKDEIAAIDRRIGYLSSLSSKFEYAKDIRMFALSEWITGMLSGFHGERLKWHEKIENRTFVCKNGNLLLNFIRDALAYFVLIVLVVENKISTGDFVFVFGAISGCSLWLNGVSERINDVIERSVKIGYYREYFDIKEKFNNDRSLGNTFLFKEPVKIEFKNVSYKYFTPERECFALENVNLTINPGEKIAIVGENGAGKTTFIKLLCGLYYPTKGDIFVNGKNVKEFNIREYYSLFSVVFQDIHLLPITFEEFIHSNDDRINDKKIETVLKKVGLYDKVMSLPSGLKTHLGRGIFSDSIDLSGGEKQKLVLARALYKDAPILVLDEPTAALDPASENELYLQYCDFSEGRTSVFVSHRLASTSFCDRIFFFENGKVVEIGNHKQLIKQGGKYAKMYELQSRYYKRSKE